jgi:hypothetical protein
VAPTLAGTGTTGAGFGSKRQLIINGLTSAQTETKGWNNEVKAKLPVSAVVRTSNTVVTITLAAESGYDVTAQETITVTVPGSALTGGLPIVATPTFTVAPVLNTGSLAVSVPTMAGVGLRGNTGTGALAVAKPTLAATGQSTTRGTGGLAVAPSFVGTGKRGAIGTGALAVTPALVGTGKQTQSATGSLAVAPTLAATGTRVNYFEDSVLDLLAGLVGDLATAHSWNTEVTPNLVATDVWRITDTVVDITFPALPAYDITAQETVTLTIPGEILLSETPIVASPTFTVDAVTAITGTGSLAVAPSLSGTSRQQAHGTGSLAVAPSLAAAGKSTARGSGSLVVAKPTLAATGQGTAQGTGSLVVALGLSGTAPDIGDLTIATPTLAGTGQQVHIGTASLAVAPSLTAVGQGAGSGTGSLAVPIPALAATGLRGICGTGSLDVDYLRSLDGSSFGSILGTGSLVVSVPAPAAAGTTSTATGSLAVPVPTFAGTGQVGITGTGSLAVKAGLSLAGTGTQAQAGNYLSFQFTASLSALWVEVHVQSTATGKGGLEYDPDDYVSTTLIDCRTNRYQTQTIKIDPAYRYAVFLIPVQYDGAGLKILYDGQGGRPNAIAVVAST